jgi:predicted metal-binding protein
MSNPTLFVCQSCNDAAHKGIKPSQGAQLLEQLNTHQSQDSPLTIQPVGCLWMCSKACVVAVSAANQPTYLFTNLPLAESAEALLQFAELYRQPDGDSIRYRELPEVLKTKGVAKIPPVA